jgi:ADP-heptose:LPS heptosyltransferase
MKRVVIIRLDHMGDLLLTTPLARAFHRAGWSVEMVVPDWLVPLFEHNPNIMAAHAIESIAPDFPSSWRPLARWLRNTKADLILLPNANDRRQLFASLFSGVRRRYAMWSGVWGRLTGHTCLRSSIRERPRPFADILLDLARGASVAPDGLKLDYVVTESERTWAKKWLGERSYNGQSLLVGIHPGCAGNACNLSPDTYGEIAAQLLASSDLFLVLTGSAAERQLVADWPEPVLSSRRLINGIGQLEIRELAAIIARLSVYVVPSTGPLHLAGALGIATISPFCALPAMSAQVWGTQSPNVENLSPSRPACESWRAGNPGNLKCDFRQDVTARQVVDRTLRVLAKQQVRS